MNDNSPTGTHAARIAVLLPSLEGGGAERSMLNLINGFLARGRAVDLVLCQAKGAYIGEIPAGTRLIELQAVSGLRARLSTVAGNIRDFFVLLRPVLLTMKVAPEITRISSLQQYLKTGQPDVVLSALTYANLLLIWAKQMSRSSVPVVVSERIALSTFCAAPDNARRWRWRYLPDIVQRTYPGANAVITVSQHAAEELITNIGIDRQLITTIHNPVVDDTLRANAEQALAHDWFAPNAAVPVILAVGRLTEQKDFSTLLRAFARVRADRPARLVILGEGRLRGRSRQTGQYARYPGRCRHARVCRQSLPVYGARVVTGLVVAVRGPARRAYPGAGLWLSGRQHRLPRRLKGDSRGRPIRPAGGCRGRDWHGQCDSGTAGQSHRQGRVAAPGRRLLG
ncbi:MAG: glycosyltransferase [Haliea sp.]|nr:glycosyltransferase [Haliea sp.]